MRVLDVCTCGRPKYRRWKRCEDCDRGFQRALNVRRGQLRATHLATVAERDGWTCQLCGDPVLRRGASRRWRPSLDHIRPLSMGGSDEPANLRLTHWYCNTARGVR